MFLLEIGLDYLPFWLGLSVQTDHPVGMTVFKFLSDNWLDGWEQDTHEPAGGEGWDESAAQHERS
jgi:hypothetical protein